MNIQGDEQTARLMDWILSEDGFEVINVKDPGAATTGPRPDVIIVNTSMAMPEKRACIEALRALVPGVGVIDLSVGAETPPYNTGADAYLAKPFDAVDRLARVRSLDGQQEGSEVAG